MIFKPKKRKSSYRRDFFKKNPGILLPKVYICVYCGKIISAKPKYTKKGTIDSKRFMYVDHVFPLNKGGSNKTFNLVPSCVNCNSRKKDKTGFWLLRGIFGKILYTILQDFSNLLVGFVSRRRDVFSKLSIYFWFCVFGIYVLHTYKLV